MKKRRTKVLALILAGALCMGNAVPQSIQAQTIEGTGAKEGTNAKAERVTEEHVNVQTADQVAEQGEEEENLTNAPENNMPENDTSTANITGADATEDNVREDLTDAANTSTLGFTDEKLYEAVKYRLDDGELNYTDKGSVSGKYTITMENSELAKVTKLNLSSRSITDITGIEQFTSLAEVNFRSNDIVDITALGKMSSLTTVGLRSTKVVDFSPLKKLPKLTSLDVTSCRLGDIRAAQIGEFTQLTELYISENNLNNINEVKNMKNLVYLEISNNNIKDLSPLADKTKLEKLYIGSDVPYTGFGSGNPVSSIEPLKGLKNLQILGLGECDMTSFDITGSQWTKLQILDIHGNELTDISSLTAARLPQLQELYLAENKLRSVSHIYEISTLENLCVSSNELGNEDLNGVSKLTNLKELSLGISVHTSGASSRYGWDDARMSNQFTDFSEVLKCDSVESLDVSGLGLTSIEQFYAMKSIDELSANENYITSYTRPDKRIIIWISDQGCYVKVPTETTKVDLSKYPLYYETVQQNPYYATKVVYRLIHCTLSEDKRYLTMEKGAESAELVLLQGSAEYSRMKVSVGTVSITDAVVMVGDVVYTGKVQEPEVSVVYQCHLVKLIASRDIEPLTKISNCS